MVVWRVALLVAVGVSRVAGLALRSDQRTLLSARLDGTPVACSSLLVNNQGAYAIKTYNLWESGSCSYNFGGGSHAVSKVRVSCVGSGLDDRSRLA
jgi:hypothetical protein